MIKYCEKCNSWKLQNDFYLYWNSRRQRFCLKNMCKNCEKRIAKKWFKENRKRSLDSWHRYYEENKDYILNKRCEYYKNNKSRILKQNHKYYEKNKDRCCENNKEWRKNNKERVKKSKRKYKSLKLGAVGNFTEKQFQFLLFHYGKKCLSCEVTLTENNINRDHVVALTNGGNNMIHNIQPLCRSCNISKGNRHSTDYRPFVPLFIECP